jgi:hypothetical protein
MHGMLSAAILILVFVLVAAASGGSVVWFYRTSSPSFGHSKSSKEPTAAGEAAPVGATIPDLRVDEASLADSADPAAPAAPAGPVAPAVETALNAPAPRPEIQNVERPLLALPAPAEPSGPGSEPDSAGDEPSAGAQIYVLDSSRRSSR